MTNGDMKKVSLAWIILWHGHNVINYFILASERWLPVHTVETIIISVISMLAEPNDESPANVDAAKEWRESYPEFKKKVARCVRKSQED